MHERQQRSCQDEVKNQQIRLNKMAGAAGLEPVTSAVTGQRSNQLSYAPAIGRGTLRNPPGEVNGDFTSSPHLAHFGPKTALSRNDLIKPLICAYLRS